LGRIQSVERTWLQSQLLLGNGADDDSGAYEYL